MNGLMETIRNLLSQGKSSREIIDLGFAPRTVYKVRQDLRRKKNSTTTDIVLRVGADLQRDIRSLKRKVEALEATAKTQEVRRSIFALELEHLRPLKVWAGHPCAHCGKALRGVVEREVAGALLRNLAHKECLQERKEDQWFPLTFERPLLEAE